MFLFLINMSVLDTRVMFLTDFRRKKKSGSEDFMPSARMDRAEMVGCRKQRASFIV